jgi:hypothetical protein
MRTVIRALAAASLVLVVAGVFLAGPASAHERRSVGPYVFVVGFETEPAYVEQPNGASLTIARASDGSPVEGAEKTLKVEVTTGGASKTMDLKRVFGKPGAYVAQFIPTKTGAYSFQFFGDVDGQPIDEKFESGPGRFNAIQSPNGVQFPVAQPSTGELQAQVTDARAAADSARTMAIVGIAVGVVGLVAAAAAFMLRRPAASGRAATSIGD